MLNFIVIAKLHDQANQVPLGKIQKFSIQNHVPKAQNTFLGFWFSKSQNEYFANAFYFDEVGRMYLGEPSMVLQLFSDGTVPENAFIEGFVDIYPRAALLSGYISGGNPLAPLGGPGISPQTADSGTYINLVRLLMGNRFGILGQSNGDHIFYGWNANPPHWLERQIFLLGTKADIASPNQNPLDSDTKNPYLLDIKAKRDAVNWWNRNPVYFGTIGLTDIPEEIDARRFKTRDGKEWVAIGNPNPLVGQTLKIKGRIVNIPSDKLSIVEVN